VFGEARKRSRTQLEEKSLGSRRVLLARKGSQRNSFSARITTTDLQRRKRERNSYEAHKRDRPMWGGRNDGKKKKSVARYRGGRGFCTSRSSHGTERQLREKKRGILHEVEEAEGNLSKGPLMPA